MGNVIPHLRQWFIQAKAHPGFRRYFANTSWMFAEQILRMIAGLLVGIWVARYLGPEKFGLFSYAIAFSSLFSSISKLGLDSIVVRDLVNEPDKRDVYLGTAFWLKLMGAVAMLVVIAFTTQFTENDKTTNLYVFIIASGAVFQSFEVIDFYFQSRVILRFVSICKLMQLFISSLLKLYFIYSGSDLIWFVFVSLVDQVTLAVSLFFAYRYQRLQGFYKYFDSMIAMHFLRSGWPLIFSGLIVTLYMRIDQIMIKEILGEKAVGIYSAAVRISEVWYFIPIVISSSLFPSIVNGKIKSESVYYFRLQRLYTFLVWIGIAVALPMTFLSDWVITFLYGADYKEAGKVLLIHIWSGIFVSLGVASGSWYTSENMQRHALYRTALGAVVNIALNMVFIPIFGLVGAAVATVISQSVAALFYDACFKRTRLVFFMKLKTLYFANLIYKD